LKELLKDAGVDSVLFLNSCFLCGKKSDNLKVPKRAPIYIIVCIYNKKQSLIKTMTLSTPASSDALSNKKNSI
jgi:hypothetical protein